jgi:outer membrane protein OmpA-like peptidoglycan-associated protein
MKTWKLVLLALATSVSSAAAETLGETFFDFDSAELRPEADAKLTMMSEEAADFPDAKLVLSGHADERGTAPYNIGLSTRRAEAVREALVTKGVPRDRIILAMYGEDAPDRETYAEDRRVTVTLTADPLYEIVDERLGPATALVWSEPVSLAELEGPRVLEMARR